MDSARPALIAGMRDSRPVAALRSAGNHGPGAALALALALAGCGDEGPLPAEAADAGPSDRGSGLGDASTGASDLPFAQAVVRFTPGAGAGFGQDDLPDIVLGPPTGGDSGVGSVRVLSLGQGGEIVLDLGAFQDGPGTDLVVFENPFYIGGDPTKPFAELGEISVSIDGETWLAFPCDTLGIGQGRWPGCAGWTPTRAFDPAERPLDPELTGGDRFDLADLGLPAARYVRIRDLSTSGEPPTAGFDLDGVAVVYPSD